MIDTPQIIVTPTRALVDKPLTIRLIGLNAGQKITVRAESSDGRETIQAASDNPVNLCS